MKTWKSNDSAVLKKPIIYSAIIHLILFISFLAFPGIYFPLKDKSIRIDVQWVELPKGTGEDFDFGVKKAEGLPKSTIEEQKQEFQPEEALKQTSIKPEMTAPPEEKPAPKAKPEPRPQVDTSKMKIADKNAKPAKPTPGIDRKIREALAMNAKDLRKGRQVVPEAGQIDSAGKGYKYGTGDKPLRALPSDPEYIRYVAMVRGKILGAWNPSSTHDANGRRLNAKLTVMINRDGDLLTTHMAKSSGNYSFDESAKRAVKNAQPFPRPPARVAEETYSEGFTIDFLPR